MATVRIQIRRGTSTEWTNADTALNSTGGLKLAAGELGVETNTRKIKIGDGTTRWSSLDYIAADAPEIGEIAQDAINDALTAGTGITKTYNDGTNTITVEVNTAVIATKAYADSIGTAAEAYTDAAIATLDTSIGSTYIPDSEKAQANGVATLDSNGLIPAIQIDDLVFAKVAYVDNAAATAVSNLVDNAPDLLNTINELAAAIGDDPSYATTVTNALATKVNKAGDSLSGNISSPDPVTGPHLANKQYVDAEIAAGDLVLSGNISDLANTVDTINSNLNSLTTNTNSSLNTINTSISSIETDIQGIDSSISGIEGDIVTINGTLNTLNTEVYTNIQDDITSSSSGAVTTANSYTDSEITAEIAARDIAIAGSITNHNAETLNVHGILDTTALATKTYADNAVSTHSSDTTSVHGIADTSELATKAGAETLTNKTVSLASNTLTGTKAEFNSALSDADFATLDGAETLTNKTLTSPEINSPSGLAKTDVGLENVDNTSDADKPISTATQTALDAKASLSGATFTGAVNGTSLILSGDLTVNGTTTTVNTSNFETTDALIYIGEGNNANSVDLGFVSSFDNGTYQHSGLVRDASDNKWKLFKGVTDEPTTTINFSQGSMDDLKVGALEATTVTPSSGVVFSDGTQTKEGVPSKTNIIQKTASYTLSSLTERDNLIEVSSASGVNVTIPLNTAVAYPVGTSIDILQTGAGQVTINGTAGVTINATPQGTANTAKLRTQWSSATLFKRAEDSWVVMGDLTA